MSAPDDCGLKWLRWLACILLCFCYLASHAQYFTLNEDKNQVKIRFLLNRNMIILPAYINGKGPFNFILDTGVGLMVITDPTLIDSIHIDSKRTIKLLGYGNQEGLEAYVTSPLNIKIQGLHSVGVGAAIFKQDHFGMSNYAGMPIHGLLGYEFFNQLAVKVNFTDSTLTVSQPGKIKPFKKGLKLHLAVEERKPYLTTCVTLANGQSVEQKIIVDLGAGHPLALENTRPDSCFQSIEANLGFGLTGPITGFMSRIDAIELGNYRLNNVITAFPDSNKNIPLIVKRDGNLGVDVLKRFTLIFDYANNALYLKRNSRYKEPFEHDMSGLEYYAAGDNLKRIIISRVEPGSAGAAIGLIKDDEITSINFKPIHQMSIVDLDNLFKSRNDRNIIIEVMRDKKYEVKILTLKRRI